MGVPQFPPFSTSSSGGDSHGGEWIYSGSRSRVSFSGDVNNQRARLRMAVDAEHMMSVSYTLQFSFTTDSGSNTLYCNEPPQSFRDDPNIPGGSPLVLVLSVAKYVGGGLQGVTRKLVPGYPLRALDMFELEPNSNYLVTYTATNSLVDSVGYFSGGAGGSVLLSFNSQPTPGDYEDFDDFSDIPASDILAAGLMGANAALGAIPFGDGVANLLKLAFNMKLSGPDNHVMAPGGTSGLPLGRLVETNGELFWQFQYIRRKDSSLAYGPKKSTSLVPSSFVQATGTVTVESVDAKWARVIINEPFLPTQNPAWFGTVEVTAP